MTELGGELDERSRQGDIKAGFYSGNMTCGDACTKTETIRRIPCHKGSEVTCRK